MLLEEPKGKIGNSGGIDNSKLRSKDLLTHKEQLEVIEIHQNRLGPYHLSVQSEPCFYHYDAFQAKDKFYSARHGSIRNQ